MSLSILNPYLPSCRVKTIAHQVQGDAFVSLEPDKRFTPICHGCGKRCGDVHSNHERMVRDLNFANRRVFLKCRYRKLYCSRCQAIVIEELDVFEPSQRVTKRMALHVHELCKLMTVAEVAAHTGLNWKTVRNIDKHFLKLKYDDINYDRLRVIAVDEIAIRKGHQYMTVVMDYETGRVLWMGKDRKRETLEAFFRELTPDQRDNIEAVSMDMWDPYIKAVQNRLRNAKIVFDFFHIVAAFNRVIDEVRKDEFRKASVEDREVFKGAKYILLKKKLKKEAREHLARLLAINATLCKVLILRDSLKKIWNYKSRGWAKKALNEWFELAGALEIPEINKFISMLRRHRYGILNHCEHPINNGKLEGTNNRIKVIKRKAYGYHDNEYFTLKVKQATHEKVTN